MVWNSSWEPSRRRDLAWRCSFFLKRISYLASLFLDLLEEKSCIALLLPVFLKRISYLISFFLDLLEKKPDWAPPLWDFFPTELLPDIPTCAAPLKYFINMF
jgi:hypothetical protein